jgi:hypothetical protein
LYLTEEREPAYEVSAKDYRVKDKTEYGQHYAEDNIKDGLLLCRLRLELSLPESALVALSVATCTLYIQHT